MPKAKENKLHHTYRVLFDQAGGPVNEQIRRKLKEIEGKAAKLREQGYDANAVRRELSDELEALKAGADRAYRETAKSYRDAIDERVAKLAEERDRKPELRSLRYREAENTIGALTPKEAAALAQRYYADEADLSLEELNELSRRLDRAGMTQEHEALRGVMSEKRAAEWWLADEEAAQLDAEASRMEAAGGSNIVFEYDGETHTVPFDSLVDLDGELDEEV